MTTTAKTRLFYGWRVVAAAFVLAAFGWGLGLQPHRRARYPAARCGETFGS